jgi:glycosyltransferase involved in cell wall biosynthesis
MFPAARIDPVEYAPPWGAGFDERLAALTARPRHIAYFYELPDTSTFRYRVFNMTRSLAADPRCDTSASWFQLSDLDRTALFVDRADALVICRTRYTPDVARMIMRAKARGIPVLFDVDDLVFDPDYAHLVMHTLDQDTATEPALDTWFGMFSRLGTVLRMCDGAITTNQYLAHRIEAFAPHLTTRIVPNFFNAAQQALSSRLYDAKRRSGFVSGDRIHIGYFSGTPTHNRDFAVAAPALARVLDAEPRAILRVVGFLEPKEAMARHHGRIEQFPLQDFMNLQRLTAEVEINIAPLQDNLFTNCKSELKYFEAAIVGTITVATPVYTFRNSIQDGDNGILACSHEWEAKLHSAIELVRNRADYVRMAEEGYAHVLRGYGWDGFGSTIEAAIFGNADATPDVPGASIHAQDARPLTPEPANLHAGVGE